MEINELSASEIRDAQARAREEIDRKLDSGEISALDELLEYFD